MSTAPSAPVVLVTGVTSGVGLALLRLLWNSKYRVVATSREDSLAKLEGESFYENDRFLIRPMDVTKIDQRAKLVEQIKQHWGGVDILVNNAGVTYRSVVEHMGPEDEQAQFDANYFGPLDLIRRVLPEMRKKRFGKIVNISSVGGMMAMPTMSSYSASKFAMEGASEALWYELRPWNIQVSLVEPGFINSDSYKNTILSSLAQDSLGNGDDYSLYYKNMDRFIAKLMGSAFATSESVAKSIIKVIESKNPALRIPVTYDAYLFSLLRRALPRRFYHWLLYRNLPGVSNWGKQHAS